LITEFILRYKFWVALGALLLLANVVVFFLFTLPNINAEAAGLRRLEAVHERGTELRQRLASLESRKRFIDNRKSELNDFYQKRLGTARQTDLVRERLRNEANTNLKPDRVSYPSIEKIKGQPLKNLSMNFSLLGNYMSLREFIFNVENTPDYFLIINSIRMDEKSSGNELSMAISVSTYYFSLEEDEETPAEEGD
jgi:Tfp pilus assembly protein PilO